MTPQVDSVSRPRIECSHAKAQQRKGSDPESGYHAEHEDCRATLRKVAAHQADDNERNEHEGQGHGVCVGRQAD